MADNNGNKGIDSVIQWSFKIVVILTAALLIVILISSAIVIANSPAQGQESYEGGVAAVPGAHFIRGVQFSHNLGCTLLPPLNTTSGGLK